MSIAVFLDRHEISSRFEKIRQLIDEGMETAMIIHRLYEFNFDPGML